MSFRYDEFDVGDKVQIRETWIEHLASLPYAAQNAYVQRGSEYEYTIKSRCGSTATLEEDPYGSWGIQYFVPAGTNGAREIHYNNLDDLI